MKHSLLTALMLAALGTLARGAPVDGLPQLPGGDPLTRRIMADAAKENGGETAVKAVVAVRSAVIELKLADVSVAYAAALAPAASPAAALKPAAGLAPKPAKGKSKKPAKRAADQLKRAAAPDGRNWGEKR